MTITLGRQAGAFASTLALTALGLAVAAPANAADATTSRLGGSDRYATSAEISKATFSANVPVAYLASGADFADALAGGAVAGRDGAPVLLIKKDSIPDVVKTELARLKPGKIVILGGESAVAASIETAADAYTLGAVERVGGENRHDTARLLAEKYFTPGVDVVYVASGQNFPDALSGAAAAAELDGPILLTRADKLPLETENALLKLNPDNVKVLGGPNAVSAAVATELAAFDETVQRVAGADRYATSAKISADTFATAGTVFIANGAAFPDALSGAPAAAKVNAPILLVRSDRVSQEVCDEVNRLQPTKVVALGGTTAVSAAVLKTVAENCLAAPTVDADATHSVIAGADEVKYTTGDVVTYSVSVKNTSNVTLHGVAVSGSLPGTYSLPAETPAVLAPGASLTFTSTYTIVAADMEKSIVTNTITVTGKAPNSATATKTITENWTPGTAPVPAS